MYLFDKKDRRFRSYKNTQSHMVRIHEKQHLRGNFSRWDAIIPEEDNMMTQMFTQYIGSTNTLRKKF